MKKQILLMASALSTCLVACGQAAQTIEMSYETSVERPGGVVAQDQVSVPWNDCHTNLQYAYLMSDSQKIDYFAFGNLHLSEPKPIVLTFDNQNADKLELSKFADFASSETYSKAADGTFPIYNLEIGQDYYYRPFGSKSPEYHFKTLDVAPRNLLIEGVNNVRDIGGHTTVDGKRIKQGLYIRGGEWNVGKNDEVFEWSITEKGKEALSKFKFATEIDLRLEGYERSRTIENAIPGIAPILIPIDYNNASFYMDKRKDELLKVFEALTNLDNYPVYLHCRIGTDRTGIASFLLGALLGMEKDDLYRDYLFSNFDKISGSRDPITLTRYINYLNNNTEGETLKEHAYNYLVGLGIPSARLDALREMFLE